MLGQHSKIIINYVSVCQCNGLALLGEIHWSVMAMRTCTDVHRGVVCTPMKRLLWQLCFQAVRATFQLLTAYPVLKRIATGLGL